MQTLLQWSVLLAYFTCGTSTLHAKLLLYTQSFYFTYSAYFTFGIWTSTLHAQLLLCIRSFYITRDPGDPTCGRVSTSPFCALSCHSIAEWQKKKKKDYCQIALVTVVTVSIRKPFTECPLWLDTISQPEVKSRESCLFDGCRDGGSSQAWRESAVTPAVSLDGTHDSQCLSNRVVANNKPNPAATIVVPRQTKTPTVPFFLQ